MIARVALLTGSLCLTLHAGAETHPPPPPVAPPPGDARPAITGALLLGLNKTTARTTRIEAQVGQTVRFGTLAIIVRDCRRSLPEEAPERAAFITVSEMLPGDPMPHMEFAGWMFSSSPAVSALQDPVYDIRVLDCSTASGSQAAPASKTVG